MSWPIYDNGVAAGLLAGFLFGYVLENAGFGSPRKLSAQFRLNDWSVFKVMFTAVIVAAVGLWLSRAFGWIGADSYYVATPFYWAMALGGLLIGAGFALAGYCPGTSAVGLAGGRLDALVFMLGMVLGTALFAAVFGSLEGLYYAAEGPEGQTLMHLLGVPEWLLLLVLIALGWAGFRLGGRLEAKLGGPLDAGDIHGRS
jgi:hypothetical protein